MKTLNKLPQLNHLKIKLVLGWSSENTLKNPWHLNWYIQAHTCQWVLSFLKVQGCPSQNLALTSLFETRTWCVRVRTNGTDVVSRPALYTTPRRSRCQAPAHQIRAFPQIQSRVRPPVNPVAHWHGCMTEWESYWFWRQKSWLWGLVFHFVWHRVNDLIIFLHMSFFCRSW